MPDLESIILQSLSDARDSGSIPDDTNIADTSVSTEVDAAVDTTATDTTVVDPTTQSAEPTDLDKWLEEEGIKAPVEGQRENRMPYSRVRKVLENGQKKWTAARDAAEASRVQELEAAKRDNAQWADLKALADADPDKFMNVFAAVNPAFKKYLQPLADRAIDNKQAETEDPEPQPDTKDSAGNPGWTREGFASLRAWDRRQAARDAIKEHQKLYGDTLQTLQQHEAQQKAYAEALPGIQQQYARISEVYGAELVKANEPAILVAMKAGLNMAEATAKVLLPLIRKDAASTRQQVLDELQKRPAAAKRDGAPSGGESTEQPVAGDVESVIKASIAAARAAGHIPAA